MKSNTTRYRKPNFLVLLTLFVGFGVLATCLAQAAEPLSIKTEDKERVEPPVASDWLPSLWRVDLAGKTQNWKPGISFGDGGKGVQLMRPFGVRGPALRVQKSIPDGLGNRLNTGRNTYLDAYLFLEKRW